VRNDKSGADDSLQQTDPTWWQISGGDAEKSNNGTSIAIAVIHEAEAAIAPAVFKLPNTQAWRTATALSDPVPVTASKVEHREEVVLSYPVDGEHPPPPTLPEYFRLTKIGITHEQNIVSLWNLMKNRGSLRHLTGESSIKVVEALRIAYITLWGKQTIRSLEVSINRARGTAAVLGELKGNVDLVLASILCEVLAQLSSDPDLDADERSELRTQLRSRFGDDVIDLCEKYNRLPVFMSKKADYTPLQSENQLQMLVAVSEDYRGLYVRLADRLHTLRTLRSLPLSERERFKLAEEAVNVYAPLAHRMGVMKVKGELEDLAFKTLNPVMFQSTKYTQIAANKAYYDAFDSVKNILFDDGYLKSQGATFKLTHRVKGKYQMFLKMQRKNLSSLNEVRDALGMRIIVDYARIKGEGESEESYRERGNAICYHLIQELRKVPGWVPAERGFKDYIKNAKENGYQSLHQYIRSVSLGTNVEIQVRTQAMDRQAELGEAAHWFYKDSMYRPEIAETKVYKQAWRSPRQVNAKSPEELISMARQQLLTEKVFVFLDDRSTVLNLPKGATSLDAAFALHSDVGLTLSTVKVGGVQVGLNHILQVRLTFVATLVLIAFQTISTLYVFILLWPIVFV
jgi:GTP pyrophosphokinase